MLTVCTMHGMQESRLVKRTFFKLTHSPRYPQFLAVTSFILFFLLLRLESRLPQRTPELLLMSAGAVLLLGGGYIAVSFTLTDKLHRALAVIFGVAAAVVVNAYPVWLFPGNYDAVGKSRNTADIVLLTVAFLALSIILSEVHDIKSTTARKRKRLTRKRARV